ncbi:MAG: dephospho-CoA kinase [Candidatus Omnitrophota bacterium]
MSIFGLTGSLSSGKSTALNFFKKKGAVIYDADREVHKYYKNKKSSIYKKIALVFPKAFKKGVINRKILGEIVFRDTKKLRTLETIVHKQVIKDLKLWVSKAKKTKRIYIAEVQLLFEKKLERLFDATILVYTPKNILIKRIENNLGFSKAKALARLKLYGPVKEKIKRADFVINNNSNIKALKNKTNALWNKINPSTDFSINARNARSRVILSSALHTLSPKKRRSFGAANV